MNILFYLPSMFVGDTEKVAIKYLNGLVQKGYQVDLIINIDTRGQYEPPPLDWTLFVIIKHFLKLIRRLKYES